MAKYVFINRADVPVVLQREAPECGAAALEMIFSFYEKQVSWEELLSETINASGICSAGDMVKSAKKHGFDSHGYKKDTTELLGMRMPCILHWHFNSFVVLEGFEGEKAFVIDPSCGRIECSIEELHHAFSGVVLTVNPLTN